jgi:hypothetical protein
MGRLSCYFVARACGAAPVVVIAEIWPSPQWDPPQDLAFTETYLHTKTQVKWLDEYIESLLSKTVPSRCRCQCGLSETLATDVVLVR